MVDPQRMERCSFSGSLGDLRREDSQLKEKIVFVIKAKESQRGLG